MPRATLAAAVILLAAAAGRARADRILPTGELGGLLHRPAGELGEELGPGWAMRAAAGLARGRLALTVPLEIGGLDPRRPERDSRSLFLIGTGFELTGSLLQGARLGLRARAGYNWRWLSGEGEVIRYCDQVGGCDGGYWPEEPSYLLSGPAAGLAATWSWPIGDARTGFALEARIERARIELPGTGAVTGPLVTIGVTAWLAPAPPH
jgi:hypothetical protein